MENTYGKEDLIAMSGVNPRKCMRCGKCSASCPAYSEMEYHPDEFVNMIERGELEPLLNSESIYRCLSCFACLERCPRGVEPVKLIEAVRAKAVRQKAGNRMTAEKMTELFEAEPDLPPQAAVSAFRKYSE